MGLEIQLGSPLILVSIFAIVGIVIDALFKNKNLTYIYTFVSLILIMISDIFTLTFSPEVIRSLEPTNLITRNMVIFGGFSAIFDLIFISTALLCLFAARPYMTREFEEKNEFYNMILLAVSGMMLIAHSNNLLVLFLGIEIMSISFYVLAGFFRTQENSIEASIKYFLLGAFSTGFLLYGMTLVYGATGQIDLSSISSIIRSGAYTQLYLVIGTGLIVIGLCFKVAAFPFHQWAPDVYHGSPSVVSAFMSTAGKSAALVAFIIIARSVIIFDNINPLLVKSSTTIQMIIAVISASTMLIGNFTALIQKNVKRMLSYSSVAHAGYMLMGIVAGTKAGWNGILFYSVAYMFMQVGAFVMLSVYERDGGKKLNLEDFAGFGKAHPVSAAFMAIFMFSLAGIPPLAGFYGKYYLFIAAVNANYTWLTIVAVISSIISMYYYIGLVLQMYFKDPSEKTIEVKFDLSSVTLILAVFGLFFFGIFPNLIIDWTISLF